MSCLIVLPKSLPAGFPSFVDRIRHDFAMMELLVTPLEDQSSSWDGDPKPGQAHYCLPEKNILRHVKIK